MEVLDREIEAVARQILKQGWSPPNDFLQKDRGVDEKQWSIFYSRCINNCFVFPPENRGDKYIFTKEVLERQQLTLGDLHEQRAAP